MMTQTAARTMDGYIRVSRRMGRKGPGYISPTVQREAIERWADYRGVAIAGWHVDEDESGGTHDRPGLNAAIERALGGETDGIVSWKIDRFSRFTEGGLRDLRRLEDADARLAFVVEDIDTSGPMGKLVYTMLLAFAEFFLDNIKAGWVETKARAVQRGAHIARAPVGYVKRPDGTLTADPQVAPLIGEAFAVAARDGLGGAVEFLRERVPQRTWTAFTVRRLLGTRTYLGRVEYGELVREDAHEALVSRATFEAANHAIGLPVRQRAPAAAFPLSGVAVCGSCGAALVGARGGNDARRMYRCGNHRACPAAVAISADPLERHVVAVLRAAFEHPGFRVGSEPEGVDEKVAAVEDAERELDAFASDLTARKLLGDRYHANLAVRVEALAAARVALQEALDAAQGQTCDVIASELWDELEPGELGIVLRAGLQSVVVSRGRGPLPGRVRVVPKGLDVGAVSLAQDP